MFSISKEIFEAESTGNSWTWEDFEAVFEMMNEDDEYNSGSRSNG